MVHLVYVIDSLVASGGAEQSLAQLALRWVAAGVRVDVVELHARPGLQDRLRAGGVAVHTVAAPRQRRVQDLRRLLRRLSPDLVHTTLWEADVFGRLAARAAGIPVVSSLVNTSYGREEYGNPLVPSYRLAGAQALDAATAALARRVHAVSEHVARTTGPRLLVPSSRIDVVPRGRDPLRLGTRTAERRATVRARLGLDDDARVVLAAARHEHAKGLDVLMEALPTVPGAVLLLAGREGNATPDLLARIARHGLTDRVHLLGVRDDVADLMVAADVVAVPSRREGMPGTVLEAMALQAPLVAADIPTVREVLIDDRHGLLVPPERPDLFGAALQQALDDRGGDRAAAAHQRFLDRFTLDAVANAMTDFHARALGSPRAGSPTLDVDRGHPSPDTERGPS